MGHNFKGFDFPWLISKRYHTDSIRIYDTYLKFKQNYPYEPSYSLNNLCNYFKCGNKDDVSLSQLLGYYNLDIKTKNVVVNYCHKDCSVLVNLLIASNLFHSSISYSQLTYQRFWEIDMLSIHFEKIFYINYSQRLGRDFPEFEYDKYEGGEWRSFENSFHKGVQELDASGMYQYLFIKNNLSPETFRTNGDSNTKDFDVVLDGEQCEFHFNQTEVGWVPDFQNRLRFIRQQEKNNMKLARINNNKEEERYWNTKQNNTKLVGNIFSGLMKSKGLVPIIATICMRGRTIINLVGDYITKNNLGNIVYVATDGIYIQSSKNLNNRDVLDNINNIFDDGIMEYEGFYDYLIAKPNKKNTLVYTKDVKTLTDCQTPKGMEKEIDDMLKDENYFGNMVNSKDEFIISNGRVCQWEPNKQPKFVYKGTSITTNNRYSQIEGELYQSFINFLCLTNYCCPTNNYIRYINLCVDVILSTNDVSKFYIYGNAGDDYINLKDIGRTSPHKLWSSILKSKDIEIYDKIPVVRIRNIHPVITEYFRELEIKTTKNYRFMYYICPLLVKDNFTIDYSHYQDRFRDYCLEYFNLNNTKYICNYCRHRELVNDKGGRISGNGRMILDKNRNNKFYFHPDCR